MFFLLVRLNLTNLSGFFQHGEGRGCLGGSPKQSSESEKHHYWSI